MKMKMKRLVPAYLYDRLEQRLKPRKLIFIITGFLFYFLSVPIAGALMERVQYPEYQNFTVTYPT